MNFLQKKILILDLDNTIFETSSMSATIFQPLLEIITTYTIPAFGEEKTKEIVEQIWQKPFDFVAKKYGLPLDIQRRFYEKIKTLDYQLEINPYDDYPTLQKLSNRKILVTTGFEKLQRAKMKALNILDDFEAVYIDDPSDKNRIFKKGIFLQIMQINQKEAKDFCVIGDSPSSELKAGKELGIFTIQRIKKGQEKSEYTDKEIYSFLDLKNISA